MKPDSAEHTYVCMQCYVSSSTSIRTSLETSQVPSQELGWWQCIGVGYARLLGG